MLTKTIKFIQKDQELELSGLCKFSSNNSLLGTLSGTFLNPSISSEK